MKGNLTNFKNKLSSLKAEAYCTMAAIACGAYVPDAYAAPDAGALLKNIADIFATKVFPLIGGVLVLLGVFKLVMAIRNDQPESQASAARDIVIGAVIIAFGVLFWPMLANNFF